MAQSKSNSGVLIIINIRNFIFVYILDILINKVKLKEVSMLKLFFSCITKGTVKDKNTKFDLLTVTPFSLPF